MELIKRVSTVLVSTALLASSFAPAAFAADLEISDNGAGSNNTINVTSTSNTTVNQTSNTDVDLTIGVVASTGGNQANGNNGGNVSITTGNATSNVTVSVTGGSNTAWVNPCGCPCSEGSGTSLISGNGAGSTNKINKVKTNKFTTKQKSNTDVDVTIWKKLKTGKNKANHNNGGTTTINTGDASSTASATVNGGSNTLNDCGCGEFSLPI